MRRGAADLGGRQHADRGAFRSADAHGMHADAEEADGVDEDERRLQWPARTVDVELHGLVPGRIQRHQLGGHVAGHGIVEGTAQEHDPPLEQLGPEQVFGRLHRFGPSRRTSRTRPRAAA